MEDFKSQLNVINKDVFDKINDLLRERGIENAEVIGLKITRTNKHLTQSCPPGKELYCWTDISGKTQCKCIPKATRI